MTISVSSPQSWKRPHVILAAYGLLGGLSLLPIVMAMVSSGSEPNREVLFGLSIQRLALAVVGVLLSGLLVWFGLKVWRFPEWAGVWWHSIVLREPWAARVRWLALVLFIVCWIVIFLPAGRLGVFEGYVVRVFPFILWLAVFGGSTLVILLLGKHETSAQTARQVVRSRLPILLGGLVVLLGAVTVVVSGWRFGLYLPEEFAYGPGVPVLGLQMLAAFGLAMLVRHIERTGRLDRIRRLDLWVCLALWIVTAAAWTLEPIRTSYFNPGPYPPNDEFYPFSDASVYDIGAQYVLIGQGLNSGMFFDRPAYLQFLFFLHVLAGQDYAAVVNLQSAVFAVFPVFLYLLGGQIGGRPLAVGLAALGSLRGLNAIAGSALIDLGGPKLLLTDFSTAVGMALLVYLTVRWLRQPAENRLYIVWAGAVTGLLSLIRTNTLLLVPLLLLLVLIVYRRRIGQALISCVVLTMVLAVAVYPWGFSSGTSMLDIYIVKFREVIRQRYFNGLPSDGQLDRGVKIAAVQPAQDGLDLGFIPRLYFHNVLNSILILPASPFFHDLRSTVKEVSPYWRSTWDRSITSEAGAFLSLQFFVLMFGIGMAWRRAGLAGLAPLAAFLVYQLTNALARTSGGRYIAPIDWVVLVYYLLGLIELFVLAFEALGWNPPASLDAKTGELPHDESSWSPALVARGLGILAAFFVLGLTPIGSGAAYPPRFTSGQITGILNQLEDTGHLQSAGVTHEALAAFLIGPDAVLLHGRALYPRFYPGGAGEMDSGYPYRKLPFPRLAFKTIGPRGTESVLFPFEKSSPLPNASDVLILGCLVPNPDVQQVHVHALVVFVLGVDGEATAYSRQPPAPLKCPAPAVECNQDRECLSAP
jgi:hypothetical protein